MKVLGTLGLGLRKEQHHLSISSVTFPARQIQQKVFLKRSNMAISRSAMTGSGLRTFVANSALEAIFGPQGLIRAAGSESGSSLRGIATASAQPNIFGQLHHGACKCSSCTRSGGSHQLGCTRSGCNSVSVRSFHDSRILLMAVPKQKASVGNFC